MEYFLQFRFCTKCSPHLSTNLRRKHKGYKIFWSTTPRRLSMLHWTEHLHSHNSTIVSQWYHPNHDPVHNFLPRGSKLKLHQWSLHKLPYFALKSDKFRFWHGAFKMWNGLISQTAQSDSLLVRGSGSTQLLFFYNLDWFFLKFFSCRRNGNSNRHSEPICVVRP